MFDFMKTIRSAASAAVLALGLVLGAGAAQALTINETTYQGNDCAGIFGGTGGTVCMDPEYDSPILFKVNFEKDAAGAEWGTDNGNIIPLNPVWEANYTSFPTLPDLAMIASWFTFDFTSDEGKTGTWTYSGPDTFGTTSWVAKSGNVGFIHYWTDPQTVVTSGSWSIGQGLSHLSFYDTAAAPIPLPAAGWLLIGGLGALVAVRRRRKAA